jgi:diguanylate cyclase (GGDEF)-like protein
VRPPLDDSGKVGPAKTAPIDRGAVRRRSGKVRRAPEGDGSRAGACDGQDEPASPPRGGTGCTQDQHAAFRVLRETARAARDLGAPDDGEVLRNLALITFKGLGYRAFGVAIRGDDDNFYYRSFFSSGTTPARSGRLMLTSAAYGALCDAANRTEGVLWIPAGHPILRSAVVTQGTVILDAATFARPERQAAMAWAPMIASDGGHVGFVSSCWLRSARAPTVPEAIVLETMAEIAGLGVELRREAERARRGTAVAEAQRGQLEELISASLAVRGQVGIEDVLAGIVRSMVNAAGFRRATVYLLEGVASRPVVYVNGGFAQEQDAALADVPITLVASVGIDADEADRLKKGFTTLSTCTPLMRPDMRVSRSFLYDHRYFDLPPGYREQLSWPGPDPTWAEGQWHPDDSLTVPLEDGEGSMLGLISMDEPLDRKLPNREDCRAMEFFADQCALSVAESQRLQAALQEATTDELTGLANRRGLLENALRVIEQAQRTERACSALYIDIDHFKDINDSFGHPTGDEVIAAVGDAIGKRLRRGDLVARYGGEEFVAILPDTHLEEAVALAEQIREIIGGTELVHLHPPLYVRVSVGVACLRPGDDTASLLAAADTALYRAKRSGRNRVCAAR